MRPTTPLADLDVDAAFDQFEIGPRGGFEAVAHLDRRLRLDMDNVAAIDQHDALVRPGRDALVGGEGIAGGWRVTDASTLTQDRIIETDVVIIGSGAGGGTSRKNT